ncbi:hypothetical protein MTBPR1_150051 [Candidatus Terasakiella magnetica]|uniref:Hemerythrin-like domain-containing protein n=1 Tax=Candidatus Terasakiella magnetica TaxID=1867952 RepID=A0A1C3RFL8_9PROT|nr:hemerythrin domain-containing protein [Candidatus Terasakiella magnetica]SCA56004.1 hypothetical protein MTBPR1_150051 [Candidatus Terasakiella magnetica]
MSIFTWQDAYSVDEGMIDTQHKKLLKIAETLFNAVLAQKEEKYIESCFDDLLSYTQKHFNDEETYFKKIGSEKLSPHAEEHKVLATELQNVWQMELLGFNDEKGRELLTWVEDRLIPHMMIDDSEAFHSAKD